MIDWYSLELQIVEPETGLWITINTIQRRYKMITRPNCLGYRCKHRVYESERRYRQRCHRIAFSAANARLCHEIATHDDVLMKVVWFNGRWVN